MGTTEPEPSQDAIFEDAEWEALGLSRTDIQALLCDVDEQLRLTSARARRRIRKGFPQLEPYDEGQAVVSVAVDASDPVTEGLDPSWTAFFVVQVPLPSFFSACSGPVQAQTCGLHA